jgi:hypothetical protein
VMAVKNGDSRLSNSNIAIVLRAMIIACSQHSTACLKREMCDLACASRWGRDEILIARLGGVEWALEHYCAVVPTFSCSARRRSWVASAAFQPECEGGQVIYTSLTQDYPLRHSQQARREYMQPSKLLYTTRTLPPPHALGLS